MGNVLSLLAFLLSIVAVVLAGVAFFRVESRLAEENRLKARNIYELRRIAAKNAEGRRSGGARATFSDDDLIAPAATPPEAAAAPDSAAYPGYPSRKSIELAVELDKKRQEARRLAIEAGVSLPDEGGDDGRNFIPSVGAAKQG